MKMEERDRLIEERGEERGKRIGECTKVFQLLLKLREKEMNMEEISEILDEKPETIEKMLELIEMYPEKSARELALM